jgi:hypothetical protein
LFSFAIRMTFLSKLVEMDVYYFALRLETRE